MYAVRVVAMNIQMGVELHEDFKWEELRDYDIFTKPAVTE
jgi:hypothetical protein